MKIIVGIDGTDDRWRHSQARNIAYDEAFKDSFVTKIARTGRGLSAYWRGPLAHGDGLVPAINGAERHITNARRANPNAEVLLTGYSRGAAGVVSLAHRLERARIRVEAMMLFDCVDRHMFIDAATIPANVRNVLHVMRHPNARSRHSFGNDGTFYYRGNTRADAARFMCTHGGMGGTFWKPTGDQQMTDYIDEGFVEDYASTGSVLRAVGRHTNVTFEQDERVSGQVWRHVTPFCQRHGFI